MKRSDLSGKVAVVTGSGRGIGKAIARELAERGAAVVLNGRNRERLELAEKEIREIHPSVISVCCDVAEEEGGKLLIGEALKAFGRIDILVNNVGVSMRGRVAELRPEVFSTIHKSNVMAAVSPTIPALPYLRDTRGSIVFISSLAGIRGLPFVSAYSASKMALRAIAESIRIEEAENGLHVGLVYVGYTEIDAGKETIAADGTPRLLEMRGGKGVQSKKSVAHAVVRNIVRRRFITVLTPVGKLNAILQPRFPMLVERIIRGNIRKFEERGQ